MVTIEEQILRDEGFRQFPYTDTANKLTIGIGRNLSDVGISLREAQMLLKNDLDATKDSLKKWFPWTDLLDPVRYAAVVNMGFNMGVGKLAEFKNMLSALQAGDYEKASREMLNSKWSEQVGARAQRLAIQIRTGEWT